jgi:long-chain acyl-CoA synthetase
VNLAENLARTAQRYPDRPAIRLDDTILTYERLDRDSARAAGLLRERGVRPGDRVAVMLPNVAEFAVVYYGVLRAGAVVVPMNPLLKEREVAYYLADSGAALMFASAACAGEAAFAAARVGVMCVAADDGTLPQALEVAGQAGIVERSGTDTAVLLYTSGTTGRPKGAELTHANLSANVEIVMTDLLGVGPDDVILGGLPLFHSFGQTCGLNTAVAAGACLTLVPRFSPERVLQVLQRDAVTIFEGVPTMYIALLGAEGRERYDVSALRVCVSGGAALPVEVLHGFEKAFGCAILEGYGLSETSPVASFNHPDRERKPGSIGTPIRGVEMRLVGEGGGDLAPGDVGEIAIRGHNVMKGYWQREEATAEAIRDGWFRTGDIARRDEDGFYFIIDRAKDMIIRGGYNVYPREIEEVMMTHPAVSLVAVVGIKDERLGEEIKAYVVPKDGVVADPDEIIAWCKDQMAAHKYPRLVEVVQGLPMTSTGKILKRELRDK